MSVGTRPIVEKDPPPPPAAKVPHQGGGLGAVSSTILPGTTAESATALPVLWGTAKVPALLLERAAPVLGSYSAWQAGTSYVVGDYVTNAGMIFQCVQSGTSAGSGGPATVSGQLANVSHGITVPGTPYTWTFTDGGTFGADAGVWNQNTGGWMLAVDSAPASANNYWCNRGTGVYTFYSANQSDAVSVYYSFAANSTPVTDNTCSWSYVQAMPLQVYSQRFSAALCEGAATAMKGSWWDQERAGASNSTRLAHGMTPHLGPDAGGQTSNNGYYANYEHTALVSVDLNQRCFSGTQQEIPAIAVEVAGALTSSTIVDPSPADIVTDLLTHSRRGAGLPSSLIDTSITGTAAAGYRVYCDATGLRFSMLVDSQRSVLDILGDILAATNSDAVWSGGKLKIQPLGDQTITSPVYGSTSYVPSNVAQYDLTIDDFLDKTDPVKITRRSAADCLNAWPIEYTDRAQGYIRATLEDPDVADIDQRGIMRASTTSLPIILPDGTSATALSRIIAQRNLYNRNEYTFRLGWRYVSLEPTDIVTLTEPLLGLVRAPVRITSIEDAGDAGLTMVAEDYLAGVQAAARYKPARGDGYQPSVQLTASHIMAVYDVTTSVALFALAADIVVYNGMGGFAYFNGTLGLAVAVTDVLGMLSAGVVTIKQTGIYQCTTKISVKDAINVSSGTFSGGIGTTSSNGDLSVKALNYSGMVGADTEFSDTTSPMLLLAGTTVGPVFYAGSTGNTLRIYCDPKKTFFMVKRLT